MLKLKKIHILGFKSFCDRTELTVPGTGIAVVVGPNGCGKSNILDGVTWVLGEQSAKTLRGTHMQDVIFAGTRDRKSLGMAEVTLTMVDPEAFDGPMAVEPEVIVDNDGPADWDENEVRRQRAAEAEEIISAEQPGQVIEEESGAETPAKSEPQAAAQEGGPQAVVLKIRRRKFHHSPQKGEIVITRRLFRTGESEYLLNGKLCRLRDIQDIFMGTGLGPESYAMIGQERIGQLLSSKPHDRRAIIEEAAGITRFKTKKRLAELRLESAKQNLARVDDIFEEVTRQMNSLKRQAAKAERFAAARDELRGKLRVVLASRMAAMDAEQAALEQEISELTGQIGTSAVAIEEMEASQHTLNERALALDHEAQETQNRANESAVELERTAARERANAERVIELEARITSGGAELETTRAELGKVAEERTQHHSFMETAAGEAKAFRQKVEARQQEARTAAEEVFAAERQMEASRRSAMHLLTQAGNARNQMAQSEESLAALEREAERLENEMNRARAEREHLGVEGGQVKMRFETAAEALKRLESEIAEVRASLQARRGEEGEVRARSNQLRGEQAAADGRRNSLEALIRTHGYATDSVKRLLKPGVLAEGMAPVGTLADFVEVSGEHEGVVDEFLRDELNYVVVESWGAAEQGVQLLKSGVDGRATFLIHAPGAAHPDTFAGKQGVLLDESGEPINAPLRGDGVTPLKESIRVLNGFGNSLEWVLPKLKHGYLVDSTALARELTGRYAQGYFLTPEGECFHNSTVTGGKPASEGPLALKRELRETQAKLNKLESGLAQAETDAAMLTRTIESLAAQLERLGQERRQAETDAANEGAALKQVEAEAQRVGRRLEEWVTQAARNKDAREAKHTAICQKREETERLEQEHARAEKALDELQAQLATLRQSREALQQEAAHVTAELAGLEERRRGAEATFHRIDRQHADLDRRIASIEQQRTSAITEREQRTNENVELAGRARELAEIRGEALERAKTLAAEAQALRTQLTAMETELKTNRAAIEQLRDRRAGRSNEMARLQADLEHLEGSCLTEVNVAAEEAAREH